MGPGTESEPELRAHLSLLMISAGVFLGAPTPASRFPRIPARSDRNPALQQSLPRSMAFWEPQDLHLTILSQTGRSISGPCFDLILRSAFFAARLMSAAERLSIRFACLNSLGLIGRGFRETPFPSRFARMQNAAIRPNGLSLAGIRYHGANFVDVSSNMSSIATT